MTYSELRKTTVDELKAMALKKGRKGNASADALAAQLELIKRNGGAVASHHHQNAHFLSDEYHGEFTKKFKQ